MQLTSRGSPKKNDVFLVQTIEIGNYFRKLVLPIGWKPGQDLPRSSLETSCQASAHTSLAIVIDAPDLMRKPPNQTVHHRGG